MLGLTMLIFYTILAGSKFWHTGAFEVKKETNTDNRTNSLDVNISSDLLGVSEVQVRIMNGGK
jgi:hypothetical protein